MTFVSRPPSEPGNGKFVATNARSPRGVKRNDVPRQRKRASYATEQKDAADLAAPRRITC